MTRLFCLAFGVMLLIQIGATTTPATTKSARPAFDSLPAAEQRVRDASWRATTAKLECVKRLRATEKYQSLERERAAAEASREAARDSGTPQQKLEAARLFAAATKSVNALVDDAVQHDPAILAAEADAQSAQKDLDALRQKLAADHLRDVTGEDAARASKTVSKGMTYHRVWELWGEPDIRERRSDGTMFCVWKEYEKAPSDPERKVLTRELEATFRDDKLIEFQDSEYKLRDER